MSDTQTSSAAARRLAAQRWGASKLVRLAAELELRAAELPDPERTRLRDALDLAGRTSTPAKPILDMGSAQQRRRFSE